MPPDHSCRTGTTHGYDVYTWNCINNQKVVVYQYSSEMTCQKPHKEITACGQLTPIEKKISSELQKGCQKMPEFRQWQ